MKAVITGGSSGIGKAAALQLARQGASVAIVARDTARLEQALAELRQAGPNGRHLAVALDVTDDASVEAGARRILQAFGGVDLLLLNQGFARCAPLLEQDLAQVRALLETNLLGHLRMVRALAPAMVQAGGGTIGLVTSMLGFMSFYGYGAYSASKFGIVGMAEALRQEMLPHGVKVCVFYPPTTDTPGLAEENRDKPALTWAIEGTGRTFSAERVAAAMLQGFRKGRFAHTVGLDSWAIYLGSRWAPGLIRWVADRELHKGLARQHRGAGKG